VGCIVLVDVRAPLSLSTWVVDVASRRPAPAPLHPTPPCPLVPRR